VERQMKRSIKMIADFWYTAWVNAGQPELGNFSTLEVDEKEKVTPDPKIKVRGHDNH